MKIYVEEKVNEIETLPVVRHLLTVLKNGYEFNNDEIMFNDCDEMAKFIGFKDFKDLQEKVDTPKVFEIIVNCA
jgi:hypothetical protein